MHICAWFTTTQVQSSPYTRSKFNDCYHHLYCNTIMPKYFSMGSHAFFSHMHCMVLLALNQAPPLPPAIIKHRLIIGRKGGGAWFETMALLCTYTCMQSSEINFRPSWCISSLEKCEMQSNSTGQWKGKYFPQAVCGTTSVYPWTCTVESRYYAPPPTLLGQVPS